MKYSGVNHLALVTGDMDKTIRFWRDLLGMRILLATGRAGNRQYFFEVSALDMVAFFEWDGVEPLVEKEHGHPQSGPFSFDHVSFGLNSEDDLYELKDKLNAADFWVSEVVDHGFILSIYTFDPNGIPLEFSIYVDSFDIRANPVDDEANPSEVFKEGFSPVKGRWPKSKISTPTELRRTYPGEGSRIFKRVSEKQ